MIKINSHISRLLHNAENVEIIEKQYYIKYSTTALNIYEPIITQPIQFNAIFVRIDDIETVVSRVYKYYNDENWMIYFKIDNREYVGKDKSCWNYVPEKMIKIRDLIIVPYTTFISNDEEYELTTEIK